MNANLRLNPRRGFTLIELLVVIAIIAILAAILFPVFAKAREKARQISCLSNDKQLGLSFTQYTQDNDELFPNGTQGTTGGTPGQSGRGWAAQVFAYVKSTALYHCPDDPTPDGTNPAGATTYPVSYGFSEGLAGASLASLGSDTRSVLLCEVVGVATDPTMLGTAGNVSSGDFGSVASDGNPQGWSGLTGRFATGVMSGAPSQIGSANSDYDAAMGRHTDGSNFLLADGHAKWLRSTSVSTGGNDSSGDGTQCNSFTSGTVDGSAAQTGCSAPNFAATFGTK